MTYTTHCEHAANLIAQADAIIIGTGAGMGVDSGLPDFRGNEGFWRAYPALAKAQLDFYEVASPRTFEKDSSLAWGFYGHRLNLYRQTLPHAGFGILRKWCERTPMGATVFTSNVDGQLQKSGFPESQIHECHGSIHHLQCMNECASGIWRADDFAPNVDDTTCRLLNKPPTCPHCGGLARPNIVMFGDWNWLGTRTDKQRGYQSAWLERVASSGGNVVVVEIGAGTAIPSVRHFSHHMSHQYGARIIRINPRETQVPSTKDVGIAAGALETLQKIDAVLDVALAEN